MDSNAIKSAMAALEQLGLQNERHELTSLIAESSLSEAMMIGTSRSLLALAYELIRVVAAYNEFTPSTDLEDANVVSRGERMSDSIKQLFNEDADVWPVCVCVAPDANVHQAIIDSVRA
jgi:hypothetical protein